MIRTGIIGFGGMGKMHLGCYERVADAQVVAICDVDEAKLRPGQAGTQINIGAAWATISPDRHRLYADGRKLIADPNVDLVDICLPTYLHAEHAIAALESGKHVLCEKPMALSSAQCRRMVGAAERASGMLMIAQVVRFFPAYEHLKETADSGRLGRLVQLSLERRSATPRWSWQNWLLDEARSGGAILDLHVHDVDFAAYLLGAPKAVVATGARGPGGGWDTVDAHYLYGDGPSVRLVGTWAMPDAFGFEARFVALFERGALVYSTAPGHGLVEFTDAGRTTPALPDRDGYVEEIAYFVRCIERGERPSRVPLESSVLAIRIAEAERRSIETTRRVSV